MLGDIYEWANICSVCIQESICAVFLSGSYLGTYIRRQSVFEVSWYAKSVENRSKLVTKEMFIVLILFRQFFGVFLIKASL